LYIYFSFNNFITFLNTRFTQHPIKKNLKLLTNIYIYFIPIKLSEECSVKGEWGLVNGRFIGAGKYV